MIINLTEKGKKMWNVIVSLPKAAMEMKDYCRLHPAGLRVTEEEFRYAMAHGLEDLIAKGLVSTEMVKELPAVSVKVVNQVKDTPKSESLVEEKPTKTILQMEAEKASEAIPEIKVPEIEVPELKVPEVEVPELEAPSLEGAEEEGTRRRGRKGK